MRPRGISPRLLRAYHDTNYRADGIDTRIGRRCPGETLARLDARTAVFLTAWNPWSRRMPAGWNDRMQQRLRQCLRRFRAIDAHGSLRRWHEDMLLVAGDPRPMVRLAARFRQRAVVILRDGDRTRLRLLTVSTGTDTAGRRSEQAVHRARLVHAALRRRAAK
jgi:hypothetical protein